MLKKHPIISVVLPVYNAEKFIKETIDSILAQTFSNFELIILNDGSTDGTEEQILSFQDSRIRYIKNEQNLKLIKTLNKGIDITEGKYIARMDADDVCLPERFEKEVAYLENHLDVDIVSCFPYNMEMSGNVICKSSYFSCTRAMACKFVSIFEPPIFHPGVMFRAEMIRKYKYNDHPDYYHIEAYELWHRLMHQEGIRGEMIPEFLMKYRDNEFSVTHIHILESWKRHLNLFRRALQEDLSLESDNEVLICIMTKKELNSADIIVSAFNLLDECKMIYFKLNQDLAREDIKEINRWCSQRKLAILLTSFIYAKKTFKIKLAILFCKNINKIINIHNFIYSKNRIIRMLNTSK